MPESSYWMDWFRRLWGTPPDPGPGREIIALHQLLALLLPRLETQGFLLSPDRYILLYSLLQALPADAPPGRWKFALCALLASDEGQQKAFLNIFEECLQAIGQHSAPTGEKKLDKERVPEAGGSTKPTPDSPKPPASSLPASATPPTSRPLVVELEECTDPPYSWDIVPDQEDISIEADEDFGRTLMHLRRRETAEHLVPDLPASIRATISEGGLPVFRYRNPSRPREYLLLLDRYSLDDHRAALFDHLFQRLRSGGVLIERFYYQGDPRICRNERWPQGIGLQQLQYRYPDALLIVLGSGYAMLGAKNGELLPGLRPLSGWRRRALLTPVSRYRWGRRENTLEALFALLPASGQSLRYLAAAPDAALQGCYDALPSYLRRSAEFQPLQVEGPAPRALRRHFEPGTLAWIAACAVYPALHFELTLRLGRLVSDVLGYPLLSAYPLLSMTRLHWFTEGHIPPQDRADLVAWLEHRHPELYQRVLAYLQDLMEKNPPPPDSIAHAHYQINLALLKMTRQADQEALQELRSIVRYLDRPLKRGDFVLPAHWNTLLQNIGLEVPAGREPSPPPVPRPAMVLIPGGTFQMGDVMGDKEYEDERVHTVTLSAFQIGAYEVTFAEYDAFCDATGREKPGDEGWGRGRRPVINVSWEDAIAYCNWLSMQHGYQPVYDSINGGNSTARREANGYRLPTEAEWEYAAREGGKRVRFGNGKDIADPTEINFDGGEKYKTSYSVIGEYRGRTVNVGSFAPNALGLYDMSGNVWEWCQDWYGEYPSSAQTNPRGWDRASFRVNRGGGWIHGARYCRTSDRNDFTPSGRYYDLGFRLAL